MGALQTRYDRRQHDYGKLLVLIFIPLLIPVLWITSILIKKFNRANSFTAYDLGVASLEINSIILFGMNILTGVIIGLGTLIYPSETVALVGAVIFLPVLWFLIGMFFKRAYQVKWWQAVICVALVMVGYIYVGHLHSLICFMIFSL